MTEENKGIFDISAFKKMMKTSIIINKARGSIINESNLIKAIKEEIIWGAGLDVIVPEPMKANNPLLSMENFVITSHIGSATKEARSAMTIFVLKMLYPF